jgi:hypothetical protein
LKKEPYPACDYYDLIGYENLNNPNETTFPEMTNLCEMMMKAIELNAELRPSLQDLLDFDCMEAVLEEYRLQTEAQSLKEKTSIQHGNNTEKKCLDFVRANETRAMLEAILPKVQRVKYVFTKSVIIRPHFLL